MISEKRFANDYSKDSCQIALYNNDTTIFDAFLSHIDSTFSGV